MMRSIIGWMAALLVAGTAMAARAPDAEACSSRRMVSVRPDLFMLATAGDDTLRAGPGLIQYNTGDTTGLENLHGQRVRIDRLGGDVPAELAGATEAVLVPYGSACRETYPVRRARWARPGSQVLASAGLRPREQWVAGIPTFDVEMEHGVYPDGWTRMLDSVPSQMLAPAQVFELARVLPTWNAVEAAPDSAYRPLFAWARANPDLAAVFPATGALAEAYDWLQPCRPAYDPHPVAGTYRAQVVLRRTDTLVFFFRTDGRGEFWCEARVPPLDQPVLPPRMADRTTLFASGVADPSAGDSGAREPDGGCGMGMFEVRNWPEADDDARRHWWADYSHLALTRCFGGRAEVERIADALFDAGEASADAERGWFYEDGAGGVRFEQRWSLDGQVMLEVLATRVSLRTEPER